jgi:hypothetical protein
VRARALPRANRTKRLKAAITHLLPPPVPPPRSYDPQSPGPFRTFWHTKEGTSRGNEGGPWDSPSGPMSGCLKGVVPSSPLNTMWATRWSSPTFLPTLWQVNNASAWAFVGGENVCGVYCTAWGCGANGSKWSQQQCYPG